MGNTRSQVKRKWGKYYSQRKPISCREGTGERKKEEERTEGGKGGGKERKGGKNKKRERVGKTKREKGWEKQKER